MRLCNPQFYKPVLQRPLADLPMHTNRCGRTRHAFTLRRRADRRGQERIGVLQVRCWFTLRKRVNDVRRYDNHEFVLAAIQGLAREQLPENRDVADAWNLLHLFGHPVVHQARDREALAVRQAHIGFDAIGGERRNDETLQRQGVGEIK